jgi:hypothetical protein
MHPIPQRRRAGHRVRLLTRDIAAMAALECMDAIAALKGSDHG